MVGKGYFWLYLHGIPLVMSLLIAKVSTISCIPSHRGISPRSPCMWKGIDMDFRIELASTWSSLCTFYNHLTLHIIPGPRSLSYFIFILLLPCALLIPPTVLSHRQLGFTFLPLIVACEIHAWQASGVLDVISTTVLQWSLVLLICYDPRRDFKRVWWEETKVPNGGQETQKTSLVVREKAYPKNFSERIPWVLTLLVSIRLVGWRTGDSFHDKRQPTPRGVTKIAFLRHALGISVLNYILVDISAYYARTDPYFTTSETKVDAPFSNMTTAPGVAGIIFDLIRQLPPRLVRSSILAAHIYGLVAGGFYPATFPVLGLNALGIVPDEWSPHTWPMFFGSFSAVQARGLRGLWGSWWHQMNRQIDATPGRVLADNMGVGKGSLSRKMIVTVVAFGFSGWMHMGMIPPKPLVTKVTPQEMRSNVAAFFWVQPVGFAVEVVVTMALDKIAPKAKHWPVSSLVVLVWVSAWLCLTLPLLTVPFRELGYWTVYPIPFSIVSRLAGDGYWTWQR